MRPAERFGVFAAIVIVFVLVVSFSSTAFAVGHPSPMAATTSTAPASAPAPAATPVTALPSSESQTFQQALDSLQQGAGPAAGLSWTCDARGVSSASCGPSTPGAQPVHNGPQSAASAPSFYSTGNLSDLNWTNQTSAMGGSFSVANNGAASYDPTLQEVILFGGSDLGCRWGGGCPENNTWIYKNGTWTNWTGYYDFFGAPPPMVGTTFTYDADWGGSILAGGTYTSFSGGFSPAHPNPFTWLFSGGFWYNISVTVGIGPSTTFGSAAYDSGFGDVIYVNGCATYSCDQTNVEGAFWYLLPEGDAFGWVNGTATYGAPDTYSFGSELAYDPAENELVFFGGGYINSSGLYHSTADTWVFQNGPSAWYNDTLNTSGYSCIYGLCFFEYPLGSGFGAMTWDGQLNAVVMFGGIDQYGYVSQQTFVFYAGFWYPYWVYNLNATAPPWTAFGTMPTNSADVAPVLIGGDCTYNQTTLSTYGVPGTGYACTSDSWVFEIPPEPFMSLVSLNPVDVGTSFEVGMYNTPNSGSGPNLTSEFFYGFLAPFAPIVYNQFLDFGFNDSVTAFGSIPSPGVWDIGVFEEDFFDVVAINLTYVTVAENVTSSGSNAPSTTEIDQAGVAEVNFTSNPSLGVGPYTYAWNFGAGQGTSIVQDPTYDYTAAGTFSVSVLVTDSFGRTITVGLTEIVDPMITATPSANATGGSDVGGAVSFTGTTGGGSGGDTYSWSFQDGGHGGSAATQDAAFTFAHAGTYNVYFNVTDSLGFQIDTHMVWTIYPTLAATPTASTLSPTTATSVSFNAGATGGTPALTYAWTFGDSSTSTGATPSHTYSSAGTYTVTVTVRDAYGEKVTKMLTVTVTTAPTVLGLPPTEGYALIGGIALIVVLAIVGALLMMRRRKGGSNTAPPAPWSGGTAPGAPPAGGTPPPAGSGGPPTPPSGSS